MQKFLLLILFFSATPCLARANSKYRPGEADSRLALLKQHVIANIVEDRVNVAEVKRLASEMRADGSWEDIDYGDQTRGGWTVAGHLSRLLDMAVAHNQAGSSIRNDPGLEKKIRLGLDYWLKNDFICPNWWYPEIGVPRLLSAVMLLEEGRLSDAQKEAGIKILSRAKIGMTGQNRVWLSGNVICRSLLTGDYELINEAATAIKEEVIVSEAEGIQADNSFHQHGPQQQFGNYGAAFASDILKWGIIFKDTPFEFSQEKTKILSDYLLKGMRWVIWKNQMDISACGRQLFPGSQNGKARGVGETFKKMPLMDRRLKDQYRDALHYFGGNTHFWRSDMTVHRRNDFYASVKMSSNRVACSESCNSENVQGYHLGDGACYFYQSGKEYTDIFPFWDWKRIPGTTAFHNAGDLPALPCSGYLINSDFVGGVSDGMNGIAAMAYNRDGLKARKAWFFFDDATICIGAGITSDEEKEVNTTINQSYLFGEVLFGSEGKIQALKAGDHRLNEVEWIIHDKWGYYFPDKPSLELSNKTQTGSWNNVLKRMPPKEEKADLFTLWFNHSSRPQSASYAWYVFPHANEGSIEERAAHVRLISNTEKLQAAECLSKNIAGFIFSEGGGADSKLAGRLSVTDPLIVMISKVKGAFRVTLSDPTHKLREVVFAVEGKWNSAVFKHDYDIARNISRFRVILPQGAKAGSSLSFMVVNGK